MNNRIHEAATISAGCVHNSKEPTGLRWVFHKIRYNRLNYRISVWRHHLMGKPYMYGTSNATPHRTPYIHAMAAGELLRLGRALRILEVGTFRGKSLAEIWHHYGYVDCVDLWPEGMGVFLGNMEVLGLRSPLDYVAYRGDSRKVLPELIDAGFTYDIVYIDGDHTYEGCKSDLEYGLKLVRPGGILCGDDMTDAAHPHVARCPGVDPAVRDVLGDVLNQDGFFQFRMPT